VNAVIESDAWEHTALFITWDEWRGLYDHVPPPEVDDLGLGFRVPRSSSRHARRRAMSTTPRLSSPRH
jgi:phospholipase C